MGFVVLHMEKTNGTDAGTSAHIERTIQPKNADPTRTHLNKELIVFPEGVEHRTKAIQYRLDNAGLTRKIGKNQVRAIRIMLSGSPEDMKRIESEGKLDSWCKDNMEWLCKTYGKENIVSAVLHLDEETPHIHATLVPIVTGERRKAKLEQSSTKKKYKKKNVNTARLCADDVMARDKLKSYQDTYAETMSKYGLQRGIEGSEAKHISTPQYYRELFVEKENLREDVEILLEEKAEVNEKIRDLYDRKDEARDKFLVIDDFVSKRSSALEGIESKLEKAKQEYEPYKAQDELNHVHELFPVMKEQLRIADLCKSVGFTLDAIKKLLSDKVLLITGSLYSPEHKRHLNVQDVKVRVEKESDDPSKLRLTINGSDITDWFKLKFHELKEAVGIKKKPEQRKGIRL